jgi:hypothetical protein
MKNILNAIRVLFRSSSIIQFQSAKWEKSCSFKSTYKNLDVFYNIYLPDDLSIKDHLFPTIYIVQYSATEYTVRIVNYFITIPITRNSIHSQLFIMLCHIYTAYNHTRS